MEHSAAATIHVRTPEPHRGRTQEILKKHPEIRDLFGHHPSMIYWTVGLTAGNFAIAYLLRNQPIWVGILVAFAVGAFIAHAFFVIIHEAAHNLITGRSFWDKMVGILANSSTVFPCAIGFRNFHLLHHRYQGEMEWDADLAGPKEAAWVGNSPLRKALWLLFFPVVEGVIRPARVGKIQLFDRWGLFNSLVCLTFAALVVFFWGGTAIAYLTASLFFGVGLHPLGGRWIQEHYIVHEQQETYSYYGIINKLCFNVGYHNEHHDFMMVSWRNLPRVRKMAPEFYNTLYYHTSWTRIWLRFIFDRNLTLFSRVTRPDHVTLAEEKRAARAKMNSHDTQEITREHREITSEKRPVEPAVSTQPV